MQLGNVCLQLAFDAVMLMWGKKPLSSYGARISESMLAILRHILRGEKIMSVSCDTFIIKPNSPVSSWCAISFNALCWHCILMTLIVV